MANDLQDCAKPSTGLRPVVAVLPIFLVTRLAIFLAATSATDYQVYYQYGVAARTASVGELFHAYDVEYPQLAVVFAAGVGYLADALPAGAEQLIAARPSKAPDLGSARFQVALGLALFSIDVVLFVLIARLSRQAYLGDPKSQTWRLGLYVAGTAVLGPILYDRLDLVVGAVALVSVAALTSGRSIVAYALLTAGAGFKLVPAVLLPVFVLSAAARREGRFGPALVREAIIAVLVFAAWPVLAVLFGGGDRAFIYMKYHGVRGPELGSVYAAPLLMGPDSNVGYDFGGYVVRGPSADAVTTASPIIVLAALGVALLVVSRALRRTAGADPVSVVTTSCVLVWLVLILTNKVGSPQYLLWVAPLVPLMPLGTTGDRRWAIGFVVAGLLATLTYPYLWPAVHGSPIPDQPGSWAGPTALGFALLTARWAVLAVLTVWLAIRLWNLDSRVLSTQSENAVEASAEGSLSL